MALRNLGNIVHVSSIIWFRDLNKARPTHDYGKGDELMKSFYTRGWLLDGDGTIIVKKLPPELEERAMKERVDRWEALKSAAKMDSQKLVDLTAFEEIYTIDKKKLRPVEYQGISGNRRSEQYFQAMVERKKSNEPITTDVPILIRTYSSALEELVDQLGENEIKTLGFKPTTSVDKLMAAKMAVELGASQSDLRKVFKDGMGQKIWHTLALDKQFPELRLFQRMALKPDAEGYIRFESGDKEALQNLVVRSNPDLLEKENQKLLNKGKDPIRPATQQEVATYFASGGGKGDDGNQPKVMKGDKIRGLVENFPAKPLVAMAKAIAADNTTGLMPYQTASVGLNIIDNIIMTGDFPPVELLLVKIQTVHGQERTDYLNRLLQLDVQPKATQVISPKAQQPKAQEVTKEKVK